MRSSSKSSFIPPTKSCLSVGGTDIRPCVGRYKGVKKAPSKISGGASQRIESCDAYASPFPCVRPVRLAHPTHEFTHSTHHGRVRLPKAVDAAAKLPVSRGPDVRADAGAGEIERVQHGEANGARGGPGQHRQPQELPEVLDGDLVQVEQGPKPAKRRWGGGGEREPEYLCTRAASFVSHACVCHSDMFLDALLNASEILELRRSEEGEK